MYMKIFMVGGTGLLGFDAAKKLIALGHSVVTVSLPPLAPDFKIPKNMEVILDDMNLMSDQRVKELMSDCQAFVFAAGVDERVEFPKPVYQYYKKYNIDPVNRLLTIAKSVGIKKVVILGSYFSYFAKTLPHLELTKHHPYIRSRIDQENAALAFQSKDMDVMILELPYIFGIQKGRKPVWMLYVKLLVPMKKKIYFPKGGTTMVTLDQVGQSIVGAILHGKGGTCYPVGWYNKPWSELLPQINKDLGLPDKKFVTIPTWLYKLSSRFLKASYKKKNIEPGLDPVAFVKVMTHKCYIEKDIIEKELKVKPDDIDKAIKQSMQYCKKIYNENENAIDMKAK